MNGAEAIIRSRIERPDLILMDMGLPVFDGFQAVARIRAEPALCTIPIIALTAFSTSDRGRCLAAGCDEYESKPILFERLLTKITSLLKQSTGNARGRS
jgi:CheY-like chemotaxis protein